MTSAAATSPVTASGMPTAYSVIQAHHLVSLSIAASLSKEVEAIINNEDDMKLTKSFLASSWWCCLIIQTLFCFAAQSSLFATAAASSSSSASNKDDDTIPTFDTSDSQQSASDYANYFSAYADLFHQKIMLTDHHRMTAYYNAILQNRHVFKDKVVMDVGSGSGILAVWAAKAGARRVYAVEYTDMAKYAREVVRANGLEDVVMVIQGAVEDVTIPEEDWDRFDLQMEDGDVSLEEECHVNQPQSQSKVVDIIISEWMGYFLLRESMLDSVIRARDMFLKPKSGILLPSHATMLIAPIMNAYDHSVIVKEYEEGMVEWNDYLNNLKKQYGVDMSILTEDYDKEQRDYYLKSSHYVQLEDDVILAPPAVVKTLDLAVCTLEDAKGVGETAFSFDIESSEGGEGDDEINGFAGWFTVDFQTRTDEVGKKFGAKMKNPVHFSSSPEIGETHWGQQAFYFPSAIPIQRNSKVKIDGTMEMYRSKENARLYNVKFRYTIAAAVDGSNNVMDQVESVYSIP